MTRSYDVIVLGGGLAGIAAAQRLSSAGREVALVEARPRLGGRVWSISDPATGIPIEMGAEWFDTSGPIHGLLQKVGEPGVAADGEFLRRAGDGLTDIEQVSDGGRTVHRRLARIEGRDRAVRDALRSCCSEPELSEAVAMTERYIEGFHAADPELLSLAWFNIVEKTQPADASQMRPRGGLQRAIDGLLMEMTRSCTVFLETVAHSVDWRRGDVIVSCSQRGEPGRLRAPACVVALPLPMIDGADSSSAVRFTPSLRSKRRALSHIAMGPVVKFAMTFDRPFWAEREDLANALFVQDFSQPVPTWWTTRPLDLPLLIGWAAGPQVERLGELDAVSARSAAINSIAHSFDVEADLLARWIQGFHWHDWQRDQWSQGAYSWMRVGGLQAPHTLAQPVGGTLYFAGEATMSDGYNASMDGAIRSGWRAADEALNLV